MCGICGFCSKKSIPMQLFKKMNDSLEHRGPDDSGEVIYEAKNGYCVGLAQRRLSIIDLSSAGHQPMTSVDSRLSVVFNGEIYNYLELKNELRDYPFRTSSDTEVILAGYLKWGVQCVEHFNGMFAFALYDRDSEELWLFRDRIGKKPLYYLIDDQNIVFASELKPIMLFPGFQKEIRRDILPRYLVHGYINAPDTIFQNVYKLEPGSFLRFASGKVETYKYWDIAETYRNMHKILVKDYAEAREELKRLLQLAVKRRMIADVPLGALLSGGYDSSLVSAMAQESSGSTPLKTFSIGFHQKDYNEAEYAKAVATHLSTRHTELYCDEQDLIKLIEAIPYYYDEPFADSSQIPTMLVSMLAKQDVTVVLSGDGGDEFFCGYNDYERVRLAQKLDAIGAIAHAFGQIGNMEAHYPIFVRTVTRNRNPQTKTQLISDFYTNPAENMVLNLRGEKKQPIRYEMECRYHEQNWQIRRMLLDMDTYLPGDILAKVDRASMKYALECRCPILDRDVMEYSFRIPHEFKYRNRQKKAILKDITYDYIPKELMDRPKKGFAVPLDQWMRGELKEQLLTYADEGYLQQQDLFDSAIIHQLIENYLNKGDAGANTGKNYSKICWSFYVFQQWYQKWIKK
ncbi:MAG: asparagine synthase (glutamine-hydrolyzing) [Lachnospiraceae bacterium]|nr:asparagine synthase (glutamine-hydrolyzing) [Lachnospiraceae bacterium]